MRFAEQFAWQAQQRVWELDAQLAALLQTTAAGVPASVAGSVAAACTDLIKRFEAEEAFPRDKPAPLR